MNAPLSMYALTGRGYENGWWTNCVCRYRLFKGARNTKKSYDIDGLEVLDKILSDPRRNVLMLRATLKAHRLSTFSTLQMLVERLGLSRYFKMNANTLEFVYLPTGQQVIFLGMDDPQKIASIRVPHGYLTDVYVEEAFEIDDYEKWRIVDGSIRGKLPAGLFLQVTFTFNAWNKNHWLYEKFFAGRLEDDPEYLETHDYADWCDPNLVIGYGKGLYLHISTFRINEFRDTETYDVAMAGLKETAIEIYKTDALGCWGNSTSATYECWNDGLVIPLSKALGYRYARYCIGVDFGISNGAGKPLHGDNVRLHSANAMSLSALTSDCNTLVPVDEYFQSNEGALKPKTAPEIQSEMIETLIRWRDEKYRSHPDLMKGRICVYVDCADSGGFRQSLELEARRQGLYEAIFLPSTKISILSRVDFTNRLMAYGDFTPTDQCKNLVREIKNARWTEKGDPREDFDDHEINAHEYAWSPFRQQIRLWKDFKVH